MSLGIKIEGAGVFLQMQIAGRKLDEAIRRDIRALAKEGRQEVVQRIRAPKSGRKYGGTTARGFYKTVRQTVTVFGGTQAKVSRNVRGQKATKAYTASAPGEAPAVLTGTLLRSIRTKLPRTEKGYGVKVFAYRGTAYYRRWLELGAKQMEPRQAWGPVQEKMEAQLEGRILSAVRRFEQEF